MKTNLSGLRLVSIALMACSLTATALATPVYPSKNVTSRKARAHVKITKTSDYTHVCESPSVVYTQPTVLCEGDIEVIMRTQTTQVPGDDGVRPDNSLHCSDVVFNKKIDFNGEAMIYFAEDEKGQLNKSFYGRMILATSIDNNSIWSRAISYGNNIPVATGFTTNDTNLSQVSFSINNTNNIAITGCDGQRPISTTPLISYNLEFDIVDQVKH